MGKYEPDDSRDVTLNPNTAPGEPPRTGPREGETRRPPADKGPDEKDKAPRDGTQTGYGNSRDEQGRTEQDQ
ncbi:hypothetical protein [Allopontixanthobacter sediminis]|uniref:Uncharacterized protein n=1 Tax=Allopontixanthobacter sediminis TaxID=1689985 RepID=A0A845B9F0_9SPHN|nr:hypothetical protein [Allopontixanthobacter sediminis]MXP44219.1 hypothetical protein [Allopontixanthobacter sediminis]